MANATHVVRRRSDGKYHAPTSFNELVWSANVNRAYYYTAIAAQRQAECYNAREPMAAVIANRPQDSYYAEKLP